MTDLTEAQRALLTRAADGGDGASAELYPRPTINALIKRGYLISIPRSDGPSRLLVTAAGRAAIGLGGRNDAPDDEAPNDAPAEAAAPAPGNGPVDAQPAAGKIPLLVGLLRRPQGARIDEMMAATGWQAHSVRGALSGAIKKALALPVVSEKTDGVRTWRIVEAGR